MLAIIIIELMQKKRQPDYLYLDQGLALVGDESSSQDLVTALVSYFRLLSILHHLVPRSLPSKYSRVKMEI